MICEAMSWSAKVIYKVSIKRAKTMSCIIQGKPHSDGSQDRSNKDEARIEENKVQQREGKAAVIFAMVDSCQVNKKSLVG